MREDQRCRHCDQDQQRSSSPDNWLSGGLEAAACVVAIVQEECGDRYCHRELQRRRIGLARCVGHPGEPIAQLILMEAGSEILGASRALAVAKVDFPSVDNLCSRHNICTFMLAHGWINMGGVEPHAVTNGEWPCFSGDDRQVLIGGEEHGVTGERRVTVVHAESLQPGVRNGVPFRRIGGNDGGQYGDCLAESEIELRIRGVRATRRKASSG